METNQNSKLQGDIAYMSKLFLNKPIETIPLSLDEQTLFQDCFEFIDISGHGSFGLVIRVIEKATNDYCALKIIHKVTVRQSHLSKLREEVEILKSMTHHNIVTFRHLYESSHYIFILMDYLQGGSLSNLISYRAKKSNTLTDTECSIIIKSVLEGLNYIHMKNYIHRDLKPDNLIFMNKSDLTTIKIVDFGLGVKFQRGISSIVSKQCGTVLYMPPEQAKSNTYGQSVDIWAIGIIMYQICTGRHPLSNSSDKDDTPSYLIKLEAPNWNFPHTLSTVSIDFFLHMCNKDPMKRYDTTRALQHPWITRDFMSKIPKTVQEEYVEIKQIGRARSLLLALRFTSQLNKNNMEFKEYSPYAKDFSLMDSNSIKITQYGFYELAVLPEPKNTPIKIKYSNH